MLTTNYLPVIQDISHNQITESRSCGTDDANADADAADAAATNDAAATEATAAAAATAAVAATATTIHSCQICVTLVVAWPANEHTLPVIRTHPGSSRAKSPPLSVPKLAGWG